MAKIRLVKKEPYNKTLDMQARTQAKQTLAQQQSPTQMLQNKAEETVTSTPQPTPVVNEPVGNQSNFDELKQRADRAWQDQKNEINQSALNYQQELGAVNQKANMYYENYLKSMGLAGSGAGAGIYTEMANNYANASGNIEANRQKQIATARANNTNEMLGYMQNTLNAGGTREDLDKIRAGYADDSLSAGTDASVNALGNLSDIYRRKALEASNEKEINDYLALYQQALAQNVDENELVSIRNKLASLDYDENKLNALNSIDSASDRTANEAKNEASNEKAKAEALTLFTQALSTGMKGADLEQYKNAYLNAGGNAETLSMYEALQNQLDANEQLADEKAQKEADKQAYYDFYKQLAESGYATDEELINARKDYLNAGGTKGELSQIDTIANINARAKKTQELTNAYATYLENGADEKALKELTEKYGDVAGLVADTLDTLKTVQALVDNKNDKEATKQEAQAKETLKQKVGEIAIQLGADEKKIDKVMSYFDDDKLNQDPTLQFLKALAEAYTDGDEEASNANGTVTKKEQGGTVETTIFPDDTTRIANLQTVSAKSDEEIGNSIKEYDKRTYQISTLGNATTSSVKALKNAKAVFTMDELTNEAIDAYITYSPNSIYGSNKEKEISYVKTLMAKANELAKDGNLPNGASLTPRTYNQLGTKLTFTYYDKCWYVSEVGDTNTFKSIRNEDDLSKVVGQEYYKPSR